MAEIDQWLVFMDMLETTPEHVAFAKRVGQMIALTKVPLTQMTGEGAIRMTWDSGVHCFELDVFPDDFEWFYRNWRTTQTDGSDNLCLAELPPEATRFLGLVLHG